MIIIIIIITSPAPAASLAGNIYLNYLSYNFYITLSSIIGLQKHLIRLGYSVNYCCDYGIV